MILKRFRCYGSCDHVPDKQTFKFRRLGVLDPITSRAGSSGVVKGEPTPPGPTCAACAVGRTLASAHCREGFDQSRSLLNWRCGVPHPLFWALCYPSRWHPRRTVICCTCWVLYSTPIIVHSPGVHSSSCCDVREGPRGLMTCEGPVVTASKFGRLSKATVGLVVTPCQRKGIHIRVWQWSMGAGRWR